MKIDELVAAYVQWRDIKAGIKAEAQARIDQIDVALNKIEAKLLQHFNETGQESAKTACGTAYKSMRTSITVADWDTTLPFIQANNLWQLLEHRVSKTAVEEYRAANDELPPGLNVREEVVINIRRS